MEGRHRPRPGAPRRRRREHPPPGRLDPADLAGEPDQEARRPRRTWCARLGELGVDHLITIGGDDTAFSARRVAEEAGGRLRVAHVPKTIDNDLPLPEGVPTFGFETAREHADAHRRAPARGRAHHGALVLRGDDGPHGGPPRARRGEGRRRDADADPGGVPRRARSASARLARHRRGLDREAPRARAAPTASPCSPRASPDGSTPPTSRASRTRRATSTATSASPRCRSAACCATRCRRSWRRSA